MLGVIHLEFLDWVNLFSMSNVIAIIIGTFVGLLIGALPGLGITIAIVLLLPLTYMMSPLASILLLLAAYQSAEYGGSISSIILGIPGTPPAAATVLDGYPMSKNYSPGKAISYSLTASVVGGIFGGLVLIFLSIPLSKFAIKLYDPEFFLLGILGLLGVAALGSEDKIKSLISVVMGLMVGMIGMDMFSGQRRFTEGYLELMSGVSLIAVVVGVFALTEIFAMISNNLEKKYKADASTLKGGLTFSEIKRIIKPIGIGSTVGVIVGIFPGMGSGPSAWFSYALAKKASRTPETFGQGNPEGIAAPESANNATVGGSLLPLLTLGIPGSPATAIIMAAFIIHGIRPGTQIFEGDTSLVNGIFAGFIVTTIFLYIVGRTLTPLFSRVVIITADKLVPIVLMLALVGVFVSNRLIFDVWVALIIGIVFFFFKLLHYSLPSFVLGFILSPIIEEGLRRTLVLTDGSYAVFVTRSYSLIILAVILLIIALSVYQTLKKPSTKIQEDNMKK